MSSFADLPSTDLEARPNLPGTKAFLGSLAATALASVLGGSAGVAAGFVTGHPSLGLQQGIAVGCVSCIALVGVLYYVRPPSRTSDIALQESAPAELPPGPGMLFACFSGLLLATAVGGGIGVAAGYIDFEALRRPNIDDPAIDEIRWYLNLIEGAGSGLAGGCGTGLALVGLLLWQRTR